MSKLRQKDLLISPEKHFENRGAGIQKRADMTKLPTLSKTSYILLIIVLGVAILYYARPVLVPLSFAAIFAMLLAPLSRIMEQKGVNRAIAALIAIICLIAVIAIIISLLTWQLSDLIKDMKGIDQKWGHFINELKAFISKNTGIAPAKQEEILKQQTGSGDNPASLLTSIAGGVINTFVNMLLVLVYIFLFIYFREHLKKFLIKATPDDKKDTISQVIDEASHISQQYLLGLSMMIVSLWIMYGIGFSIVGVRHAIFFAILCGTLEIVPFVGNLTGTIITSLMGMVQGGDLTFILEIIATYLTIQIIQTYILQPLVVGREVNINPLFTILVLIIGEAVWGIPGMVLAIPLTAIVKIICDHFEPLKPYGFLLGQEKNKKPSRLVNKIENAKKH